MNVITLSNLVHGDGDTTPAPSRDPRKAGSATMLSGTRAKEESRETPTTRESSSEAEGAQSRAE